MKKKIIQFLLNAAIVLFGGWVVTLVVDIDIFCGIIVFFGAAIAIDQTFNKVVDQEIFDNMKNKD